MLETLSFGMIFFMMGIRHGFDTDHIAAISDLVGAEAQNNTRRRSLKLGSMYAIGHGSIVLIIGLLALFVGAKLSDPFKQALETLVGITLIILGAAILSTLIRQYYGHPYRNRYSVLLHWMTRLLGIKKVRKTALKQLGVGGSLIIGVIHGIGAETPTQLALLSTTAVIGSTKTAVFQILLFALGILVSTLLIAFLASWGFMKAHASRVLLAVLTGITGIYSIGLGASIIVQVLFIP